MRQSRIHLAWFAATWGAICFLTILSPAERVLGEYVRLVYLHGAWVWTSLLMFAGAGLVGLGALLTRWQNLHCWCQALGRTGLLFWITYLPVSMIAAQANWNGLFLVEPRWRLAMVFAITGILLQLGLSLVNRPEWTSTANLFFAITLGLTLQSTENIMHPPAPILNSDASLIQVYFFALVGLNTLAATQIARWWYRSSRQCINEIQTSLSAAQSPQ
jgi:hypothetical protein